MISVWKDKDNNYKLTVYVPDFKISFSSLTLPILGGFHEDSEESVIVLYHIYKEVVKFISESSRAKVAVSCGQLPYEQVDQLNQISHILLNYFKEIGADKFLPDIEKCGYFPLRPTDCIPYCQYFYESVEDALYDVKMWLIEHGLCEEEQEDTIPFEIWE